MHSPALFRRAGIKLSFLSKKSIYYQASFISHNDLIRCLLTCHFRINMFKKIILTNLSLVIVWHYQNWCLGSNELDVVVTFLTIMILSAKLSQIDLINYFGQSDKASVKTMLDPKYLDHFVDYPRPSQVLMAMSESVSHTLKPRVLIYFFPTLTYPVYSK